MDIHDIFERRNGPFFKIKMAAVVVFLEESTNTKCQDEWFRCPWPRDIGCRRTFTVFTVESDRLSPLIHYPRKYSSNDDCLEDKGEIIRAVLYCVVYDSNVHSDTHMRSS